ncbi:MAG TPA: MotA/TolQ/ExbB proton channel family protein [Paenalcaligenes sp.]|nr:MotA/TolQ/ExbB proton channel family protein [Paenalcaligenes sp.]
MSEFESSVTESEQVVLGGEDLAALESVQNADMGFLHFVGQSDWVGQSLFVVLLVMSVITWYLVIFKGLSHLRLKRNARRFLDSFWSATSLGQVEEQLAQNNIKDSFSALAFQALSARAQQAEHADKSLAEQAGNETFIMRIMRKSIAEETAKLENGLTVLASIASTAPFVGLFGTVWGVYHALVNIGLGGDVALSNIAGPVGEALIMTGLGLAVAIPAVIAYNAFIRSNRVYLARLDAFAHDLYTFLTIGTKNGQRC